MLQHDLPWYLTKAGYLTAEGYLIKPQNLTKGDNETKADDVPGDLSHQDGGFSREQLSAMAERRDQHWEQLCAAGRIPTFLIHWQKYVRGLKMFDTASYTWLRRLLDKSQNAVLQSAKRNREPVGVDDLEIVIAQKKHKTDDFDALHTLEE